MSGGAGLSASGAATTAIATSASDSIYAASGYNRSACTECQRRKQKCNREWPCDRCQRRKIADECRYSYFSNAHVNYTNNPTSPTLNLSHLTDNPGPDSSPTLAARTDGKTSVADVPHLDALAASRLFTTLGIESKVNPSKAGAEDFATADSSPQMERVLDLLPQRQTMDKLITTFTQDVNYHYYIIYPPDFLRDYHIWWERRSKGRPITLQYTCLLAMVCACCVQHASNNLQRELQQTSGRSADSFSEHLHNAARELASMISDGHYHRLNVQRLLHSCYWYKAEAKFVEAWHVLSAAILEGRELGYHREFPEDAESDHDKEMRRRLWCILDTWDWQISSGLSQPKIINRVDCDAELPSLTLEKYSSHVPSPLLHMKMQSELTRKLASRFSAPKNIVEPPEVLEVQALVEEWMDRFPPVYSVHNPDLSLDDRYPWIFPHRYYVFTMACLLILNPIRHYMVKSYTSKTPAEELNIRAIGVSYSLKLMKTLRKWVNSICTRDGRLHFIVFSIFDTAAILCTAIIKDGNHTLTKRDEIMTVISDAVNMLRRLNTISKTSRTSYGLLERLVRRLPAETSQQTSSRKKAKVSIPVAEAAAAPRKSQLAMMRNAPVSSSAVSYGNRHDLRPAPRPVLRSNLVPSADVVPRISVPSNCIPVDDGETYSDYSTCSDATPSSMDEQMFSSFSTVGGDGDISVDPLLHPAIEDSCVFPPPADHASPDFDLETVTRTQLGELAPLWDWHSKNLDLVRAGASGMAGPGYAPVAVVRRML